MKAIVLEEIGGAEKLKYKEVPVPSPGPGEVLIRLFAASLNRRDLYVTHGQYPGIKLPAILGGDGAGEVVKLGDNVNSVAVGEKVIIYPALDWGDNPRVNSSKFSIVGVPKDGTFAEYIKLPAENVFPKPAYLNWKEAASITLGGVTAYRALVTRGKLKAGETVLIPGVGGGVATFLVQIASAIGAKVFVTSSKQEKIEKAKELGATGGVSYKSVNWVKELRDMTGGVDLSVDSIGGETFNALVTLAKPGSRIVSFGATKGPVPNLLLPRIFLKQLDILGTSSGTQEECNQMLNLFERYEIKPYIDKSFPLYEAADALRNIEQGDNFGKIVLKI